VPPPRRHDTERLSRRVTRGLFLLQIITDQAIDIYGNDATHRLFSKGGKGTGGVLHAEALLDGDIFIQDLRIESIQIESIQGMISCDTTKMSSTPKAVSNRSKRGE
jgi:hypothetical protein